MSNDAQHFTSRTEQTGRDQTTIAAATVSGTVQFRGRQVHESDQVELSYAKRPRTVFLEVLYGCNLFCAYCYIGVEKNHKKRVIPKLHEIEKILDVLRREEIQEVVLLGGEPTLHPQFHDICRKMSALGFAHKGLVTNGTAITLELAALLKDCCFWVDISFRGPNPSSFDSLAGKDGAYKSALRTALLLTRQGIRVGIEYDCTPDNYLGLYDTIFHLLDAGVQINQVQLHRILPSGDAALDPNRFALSLEQWQVVFEQADRVTRELSIPVLFEDGFPFCLVDRRYWDLISPCACGFSLLTVGPTGDIRFCSCSGEVLGNLFRQQLSEVWAAGLQRYRAKKMYHPVCSTCDLVKQCRGGCATSGGVPMNRSMDVFHKLFRPVRLQGSTIPTAKYIFGQEFCVEPIAHATVVRCKVSGSDAECP